MSKPHCYNCGEEIVFDKHKIGSKSGKMIPLDPQTREPHSCDQDEQRQAEIEEEELDYGANMTPEPIKKPPAPTTTTAATTVTRHSKARIKILEYNDPVALEGLYARVMDQLRSLGATIHGVPCQVIANQNNGGKQYVMFIFYDIPNENADKVETE